MSDGIKERFDIYRKWFKTLLIKEFLNLPVKYQENFIIIVEKFIKDCKEVHKDAKRLMEKTVQISVKKILVPDNKEENYIIVGQVNDSQEEVKISYLASIKKPNIGDVLSHVVFSTDGEMWYSSKEELITGRKL